MALSFPCSVKRRRRLSFSSGRAEPGRSTSRRAGNGRPPASFSYWRRSHQETPGELGQTCPVLASSADAPVLRRRVAAPPRAGFFLNVMLCRLKKRHTEVRLLRIPCFRSTQTTSSSVKSDCLSISVSKKFACFSSGEVSRPAAWPPSFQSFGKSQPI